MTPPPPIDTGSPLRVLVCGSVDDGKSTLIGRLLHDSGAIPEDQLAELRHASHAGPDTSLLPDLSLLTDGLEAEREQGITIDVAYRHFQTGRRRFLLIDCPGHEQYTRNMATGASGADLAVVLVDATRGMQPQTRRHLYIARLMGIRTFIGVVNKMDLTDYDQSRFDQVAASFRAAAGRSATVLPACARNGDGITRPGPRMPWHQGLPLLQCLETAAIPPGPTSAFRMPVQCVIRTGADRWLAGTIAAGQVAPGDAIVADGVPTQILHVHGPGGPQPRAQAGEAVRLLLSGQLDVGRGAVLSAAADPVPVADQLAARLVWCDEAPLLPGSTYLVKLGTRTLPGSLRRIRHRIDPDSGQPVPATQMQANDIAAVELSLSAPAAFQRFEDCPALGGFILIDRKTYATAGVGVIEGALDPAGNTPWQALTVAKPARARLMGQSPRVIWFTGLSGAGKTTVANLVERRLHAEGRCTYLLDGDNLRHGLCRDLGFAAADRVENVRRVGEVAALMADAGLIVLVCLISPYRADRHAARGRVPPGEFIEVFVDAPLDECRRRDPKGLYGKAASGAVPNFTGVTAPYEPPETPEIHLRTGTLSPEQAAETVLRHLARHLPDPWGA